MAHTPFSPRLATRMPYASMRRGASLAELLAVMASLGVVLSVAAGLVHTAMRLQSTSRQDLECDRTAMRLARQFRHDVRQAEAVTTVSVLTGDDDGVASPETLVEFSLTAKMNVRYQASLQQLTRQATANGRTTREDYFFASPMQWNVTPTDRCIVLNGRTLTHNPARGHPFRPLDVEIVAVTTGAQINETKSPPSNRATKRAP